MQRAKIITLHKVAKQREEGFLEACMKAGRLSKDGQYMEWDDAVHAELRRRFNKMASIERVKQVNVGFSKSAGLGDKIGRFATPIARRLGMPCVDKKTGDLKPQSGCAKRKEAANQFGEKISDMVGKAKVAIFG